MENSVAVTTLLSSLNKRVLLTKMDACRSIQTTRKSTSGKSNSMSMYMTLSCLLSLLCVTQVALACNDSVTVWTMEFGHILCVFLQNVHLHGPALGKSGMADVALIRFLSWKKDWACMQVISLIFVIWHNNTGIKKICKSSSPKHNFEQYYSLIWKCGQLFLPKYQPYFWKLTFTTLSYCATL